MTPIDKKIKVLECIYCGIPLLSKKESLRIEKETKKYPDNGETKDHVPQQCLYEGYPSSYKENRFTVPSCHKCNLDFSLVENELRDAIGISNEKDSFQNEITESSVKSILSRSDSKSRLIINEKGYVSGVEFNLDTLLPSHLKNFKGVFYKIYGFKVPENFSIHVLDTKQTNYFESLAIKFLNKNVEWKFSGHEDIFKFKISLIKPDENGLLIKTENISESIGILCQLNYHKRFKITIIAFEKSLIMK